MTQKQPSLDSLQLFLQQKADEQRVDGSRSIVVYDDTGEFPFQTLLRTVGKSDPDLKERVRQTLHMHRVVSANAKAGPEIEVTHQHPTEDEELANLYNLMLDYAKEIHKQNHKGETAPDVMYIYASVVADILLELHDEIPSVPEGSSVIIIHRENKIHPAHYRYAVLEKSSGMDALEEDVLFRYISAKALADGEDLQYQVYVELPERKYGILFHAKTTDTPKHLAQLLALDVPVDRKYPPMAAFLRRQAELLAEQLGRKAEGDDWDMAIYPFPDALAPFLLLSNRVDDVAAHRLAFVNNDSIQFIALKPEGDDVNP